MTEIKQAGCIKALIPQSFLKKVESKRGLYI